MELFTQKEYEVQSCLKLIFKEIFQPKGELKSPEEFSLENPRKEWELNSDPDSDSDEEDHVIWKYTQAKRSIILRMKTFSRIRLVCRVWKELADPIFPYKEFGALGRSLAALSFESMMFTSKFEEPTDHIVSFVKDIKSARFILEHPNVNMVTDQPCALLVLGCLDRKDEEMARYLIHHPKISLGELWNDKVITNIVREMPSLFVEAVDRFGVVRIPNVLMAVLKSGSAKLYSDLHKHAPFDYGHEEILCVQKALKTKEQVEILRRFTDGEGLRLFELIFASTFQKSNLDMFCYLLKCPGVNPVEKDFSTILIGSVDVQPKEKLSLLLEDGRADPVKTFVTNEDFSLVDDELIQIFLEDQRIQSNLDENLLFRLIQAKHFQSVKIALELGEKLDPVSVLKRLVVLNYQSRDKMFGILMGLKRMDINQVSFEDFNANNRYGLKKLLENEAFDPKEYFEKMINGNIHMNNEEFKAFIRHPKMEFYFSKKLLWEYAIKHNCDLDSLKYVEMPNDTGLALLALKSGSFRSFESMTKIWNLKLTTEIVDLIWKREKWVMLLFRNPQIDQNEVRRKYSELILKKSFREDQVAFIMEDPTFIPEEHLDFASISLKRKSVKCIKVLMTKEGWKEKIQDWLSSRVRLLEFDCYRLLLENSDLNISKHFENLFAQAGSQALKGSQFDYLFPRYLSENSNIKESPFGQIVVNHPPSRGLSNYSYLFIMSERLGFIPFPLVSIPLMITHNLKQFVPFSNENKQLISPFYHEILLDFESERSLLSTPGSLNMMLECEIMDPLKVLNFVQTSTVWFPEEVFKHRRFNVEYHGIPLLQSLLRNYRGVSTEDGDTLALIRCVIEEIPITTHELAFKLVDVVLEKSKYLKLVEKRVDIRTHFEKQVVNGNNERWISFSPKFLHLQWDFVDYSSVVLDKIIATPKAGRHLCRVLDHYNEEIFTEKLFLLASKCEDPSLMQCLLRRPRFVRKTGKLPILPMIYNEINPCRCFIEQLDRYNDALKAFGKMNTQQANRFIRKIIQAKFWKMYILIFHKRNKVNRQKLKFFVEEENNPMILKFLLEMKTKPVSLYSSKLLHLVTSKEHQHLLWDMENFKLLDPTENDYHCVRLAISSGDSRLLHKLVSHPKVNPNHLICEQFYNNRPEIIEVMREQQLSNNKRRLLDPPSKRKRVTKDGKSLAYWGEEYRTARSAQKRKKISIN